MQWQHGRQDHQPTLQWLGGTHNPKVQPAKLSSKNHAKKMLSGAEVHAAMSRTWIKKKRFWKVLTLYAGCPSLISIIVRDIHPCFSHASLTSFMVILLSVLIRYSTIQYVRTTVVAATRAYSLYCIFRYRQWIIIISAKKYRQMKKTNKRNKEQYITPSSAVAWISFVQKDNTCPSLQSSIYVEPTFSMLILIGWHLVVSPLRTVLANQITCQPHLVTLDSVSVCACLARGIFILQCET